MDPDDWGRPVSKKLHTLMHTGKGWGRGGPFNHQWERFFSGAPVTGVSPALKFNKDPATAYDEIIRFMNLLVERTPEGAGKIKWPYPQP